MARKRINGEASQPFEGNGHRPKLRTGSASPIVKEFYRAKHGVIYLGDSIKALTRHFEPNSVDLIMTSPPFGLVRKKDYGNVDSHDYLEWSAFRGYGVAGDRHWGAWIPGQATRSLYQYELLILLRREMGFHLTQDFFWWSLSKLPTPADIRRIRPSQREGIAA